MVRNLKTFFCCAFVALLLSSCAGMFLAGSRMSQLKLGMTKEEVTGILGRGFTISERRIENGNEIMVLSYTSNGREFFLFQFVNDALEGWHREIFPQSETVIRQN